jgi:two-component system, NarL family, sensor histidine kinase FusK
MSVDKIWSLRWPLVQTTFPLPLIAGLAVLYFVSCKLGLLLAVIHPSATAIWPGTGIALAAILLRGYRVWPGIFIGALAVNLTTAGSILSSLGIATGNTLEAVVGVYMVARFANGRKVFDRAEDIFKFMFLACVLATNVSASIGVASLVLTGNTRGMQPEALWLTWWLGNMAGAILVTPCFLLWSSQPEARPSRQLVAMQGAAVISLLLVGAMVFGGSLSGRLHEYPLKFICTPFVVWAAFELRPRAVALAMLAFSALAVGSAIHSARGTAISNESLLLTQVFLGVAALTGLLVSVAVTERNRHAQTLQTAKIELEGRVQERTQELEQRIASQERAEKALRRLSGRLLKTQDEERRRIARELHDSTGQSLAVLIMDLSSLSKQAEILSPELSRKLNENAEIVRRMSNELRTTSYLLHPPLLDEMGLGAGLRWYIEGFKERSKIEVRLNIAENLRLPADLEMMIFRVVQESLTNIHRHSGSATAAISLSNSGQKLTLQIRDEGKGIAPDKLTGVAGVGLSGMRERVKGFGGELEILSGGRGTMVRAVIPLGAPAGSADG